MRGPGKFLTAVVLLTTLTIPAVTLGTVLALVIEATLPESLRLGTQWVVLGITLALEVLSVRTLAIHRQVPQWWGHRYGPVAAAARYGLRMGVGPATILSSWFWWTGVVLAAMASVRWSVVSGVVFAASRFATMYALAWRNPTGVEMANRVRTVESWRTRARMLAIAAMVIASGATALGQIAAR